MLFLPATAEVIAGFIAAAEAAPDELSTIANVMPAPPMPFVPEEQHGRLDRAWRMLAYAGDVEAGRAGARAVPRARRAARRHASGRCPTRRCTRPSDADYHPVAAAAHDVRRPRRPRRPPRRSSSASRPRRADARSRSCACSAARWRACRPTRPRSPTATRRIMVNVAAFYERPDERAGARGLGRALRERAQRRRRRRLRQLPRRRGRGAGPRGLPGRDLGPARGRSRRSYDPDNLFRLNQNIPPAA